MTNKTRKIDKRIKNIYTMINKTRKIDKRIKNVYYVTYGLQGGYMPDSVALFSSLKMARSYMTAEKRDIIDQAYCADQSVSYARDNKDTDIVVGGSAKDDYITFDHSEYTTFVLQLNRESIDWFQPDDLQELIR